jgi:hypothetical protein
MKTYTITLNVAGMSDHEYEKNELLEICDIHGIDDNVFKIEVNNWENRKEICDEVNSKYSQHGIRPMDLQFIANQIIVQHIEVMEN